MRLHIPARPIEPPGGFIRSPSGDCHIPGSGTVLAHPHRRSREAAQLASRIARSPREYLPVLVGLGVAGVTDNRPTSHARGGTPFPILASGREVAHAG